MAFSLDFSIEIAERINRLLRSGYTVSLVPQIGGDRDLAIECDGGVLIYHLSDELSLGDALERAEGILLRKDQGGIP